MADTPAAGKKVTIRDVVRMKRDGKKVVVVLPAYNAAQTLEKTFKEIPFDIVDEVVLVDDNSKDDTFEVAKRIGLNHIIKHEIQYQPL